MSKLGRAGPPTTTVGQKATTLAQWPFQRVIYSLRWLRLGVRGVLEYVRSERIYG